MKNLARRIRKFLNGRNTTLKNSELKAVIAAMAKNIAVYAGWGDQNDIVYDTGDVEVAITASSGGSIIRMLFKNGVDSTYVLRTEVDGPVDERFLSMPEVKALLTKFVENQRDVAEIAAMKQQILNIHKKVRSAII